MHAPGLASYLMQAIPVLLVLFVIGTVIILNKIIK